MWIYIRKATITIRSVLTVGNISLSGEDVLVSGAQNSYQSDSKTTPQSDPQLDISALYLSRKMSISISYIHPLQHPIFILSHILFPSFADVALK